MRPLRAALAACALAAAPAALLAQQTPAPTAAPSARTIPPVRRASPMPSGAHARPRPGASGAAYAHGYRGRSTNPYAGAYPIVINDSVVNRLLATPSPKPKPTPEAKSPYGEQTFETHSSDDAR